MTGREAELEAQRQRLLLRSERLRGDLAQHGAQIQQSIGFIDRGIAAARALTSRPKLVTGALALLLILRPKRALSWITRGAVATSLLRRALDAVSVGKRGTLEANDRD
jgi:hypothetical protein